MTAMGPPFWRAATMVPPVDAQELEKLVHQHHPAQEKTYFAITIPRLVKLHSPKFRFNSCLCPKAASKRTSSISPFVFSGVTPLWDDRFPSTVMVSVQISQMIEQVMGECKVNRRQKQTRRRQHEKGDPAN
jgi:hypothetical protein